MTSPVGFPAAPVYVIDDDRDVRRSLSFLLGASRLTAYPFASGEDFLDAIGDLSPGCVLLDLRMPQMDGFQVMSAMHERDIDWPVIVMTGHGEVPVAVRAMKQGAVDFVEKPFSEELLLSAFEACQIALAKRLATGERRRRARARLEALTSREREVLGGLVSGLSNKRLAAHLGLSLRTIEMHRANMMHRLGAESLAEALRFALDAGFEPEVNQAN